MNKKNINLFLCGSGHGIIAVLNGFLNKKQIFQVCTDDPEVIKICKYNNISYVKKLSLLKLNKHDIIIVSSYKPKITQATLSKARFINIHYALLPRYRGMHPIVWSILNNEKYIGYTLHEMTHLLDQGPILYQEKISIKQKTSWELMLEVDKIITKKIFLIFNGILANKYKPRKQIEKNAIYVAPRNYDDCRIIWKEWNVSFFERAIRALVDPYPLPYFIYKKNIYSILDCKFIIKEYKEIDGRIVYIDDDYVFVKIPKGIIKIKTISKDNVIIPAIQVFKKIGIRLS